MCKKQLQNKKFTNMDSFVPYIEKLLIPTVEIVTFETPWSFGRQCWNFLVLFIEILTILQPQILGGSTNAFMLLKEP